jgi:diadenylate cyclase
VLFFIYVIIVSIICIASNTARAEYSLLITAFIICIVLLFATEIKRSVWNVKKPKTQNSDVANTVKSSAKTVTYNINEIIKALQTMSKNDVGAIIVLSTGNVPSQIIDSGIRLESDISSELIESVFFPKTPLHDGAMIVSGTKIVAAGCFLPLSQNEGIPKDLGTRHRAGIGVTETIDVMSLIVSEETGIISIAKAGKITRYADFERLKQTLSQYYWQELDITRR